MQEMRTTLAGVAWAIATFICELIVAATLKRFDLQLDGTIIWLLSAATCGAVSFKIARQEPRLKTKEDFLRIVEILIISGWVTVIFAAGVMTRLHLLTIWNLTIVFSAQAIGGIALYYAQLKKPFEPAYLGGMAKMSRIYGIPLKREGKEIDE